MAGSGDAPADGADFGGTLLIQLDGEDSVLLKGVRIADLHQDDFILA